MSKNNHRSNEFKFRRNDDIGAAAAEHDSIFLKECFIDNGDLSHLEDCSDPKRIIIGRTGAGKSALLTKLGEDNKNVIRVSPKGLSLNYIATNNLISFFEETGVNLSMFYGLLWKHIFVVELLKVKFNITDERSQKKFMDHFRQLIGKKDRLKEMALDYFERYDTKFWLTTEERLKELTENVEQKLNGAVTATGVTGNINASAARNLSSEKKSEVVERGQKAVSEIQVRELRNLISILNEDVFDDKQQNYYLTLDTLDEEWADDKIRFKLIKSLIETVMTFRKVSNVKIILALRQDLLNKVLHSSHVSGFQEEKYESLYLDLRWSNAMLTELIDTRISFLVKRTYTNSIVTSKELLPANIDNLPTLDYMLARTFNRPRDIILFLNECIKYSEDANSITAHTIKQAEEEYSYKRVQSLATEWLLIYPNLEHIISMFYEMKSSFPVSALTEELVFDRYAEIADKVTSQETDTMVMLLNKLYADDGNVNFASQRSQLLRNLFTTGFLGIKTDARTSPKWSTDTRLSISPGKLKPSSIIYIHPMFYRALSIQDK